MVLLKLLLVIRIKSHLKPQNMFTACLFHYQISISQHSLVIVPPAFRHLRYDWIATSRLLRPDWLESLYTLQNGKESELLANHSAGAGLLTKRLGK